MSQNDTGKWLLTLAFGFLMSSTAFAEIAQPFKACVDQELLGMGVSPLMQNRWNPNTIAGKLQIIAIKRCNKMFEVGDVQENHPASMMPANFQETDGDTATGIREI